MASLLGNETIRLLNCQWLVDSEKAASGLKWRAAKTGKLRTGEELKNKWDIYKYRTVIYIG